MKIKIGEEIYDVSKELVMFIFDDVNDRNDHAARIMKLPAKKHHMKYLASERHLNWKKMSDEDRKGVSEFMVIEEDKNIKPLGTRKPGTQDFNR